MHDHRVERSTYSSHHKARPVTCSQMNHMQSANLLLFEMIASFLLFEMDVCLTKNIEMNVWLKHNDHRP